MQLLAQLLPSVRAGDKAVRPNANRFRPEVCELEPRWVPSGTPTVDLTSAGAMGSVNGAYFRQYSAQPTGSGVLHSFVRLQADGVEQGYNTAHRPLQFDENSSPVFTRALPLSEVPTVIVGGVTYRAFSLDINQKNSSPMLSLDELRLYVGGAGNLSGYNPATLQLAGLSPVYDLGAGGDHWIRLNAGLSHGSGSGDMIAYVPDKLFSGGSFVYLYSKFGVNDAGNGGFEEWSVGLSVPFVPPPPPTTPPPPVASGPSSLSGFVTDTGARAGFAGITITLTGTDYLGNQVTMTTTTGADGSYSFTGLAAGTYSLTATIPNYYVDSGDLVGTVNGVADGTRTMAAVLGNITLGAGQAGVNYDFGFQMVLV